MRRIHDKKELNESRVIFSNLIKFFSLFVLISVSSCGQVEQSNITHKQGEIFSEFHTRFNSPEFSKEKSFEIAGRYYPGSKLYEAAPIDNETNDRIGSIVIDDFDKLVHAIDQSARGRGFSYPKPKLAFLETSEPNAFVVSAFYCYARKDPVEGDLGIIEYGEGDWDTISLSMCDAVEVLDEDTYNSNLTPDDCEEVNLCPSVFSAVQTNVNWIFVSTSLLEKLTHDQLMLVLAHELAHYYMKHQDQSLWTPYLEGQRIDGAPVEFETGYDFLFQLEKYNKLDVTDKFDGAIFDPALFGLLLEISKLLEDQNFEQYKDLYAIWDFNEVVNLDQYLAFEKELKRQLQQSSGELTKNDKITLYITAERDLSAYLEYQNIDVPEVKQNILEFIENLNFMVLTKKIQVKDLRKFARALKLSFYTHEQQADDIALEYLSIAGYSTVNAHEAFFALMTESEKSECTSEVGKFKMDPTYQFEIKDWQNPHHSLCYRAINLIRENNFHGYKNL